MTRAPGAMLGLAAALALAGCAATGFYPESPTMPVAKAGLQPEYRIFYDALEEYGDWTLIEPFGYVFRPRVSFVAWQPYQDGFWVPSDVWGWVWISSEPYGWATYHYGSWMYDTFQGWVWIPGLDWGPAWVSWRIANQYVGWAPLGPNGVELAGSGHTYVPLGGLASTNLKAEIVPAEQIAEQLADAQPIRNTVVRGGVTIDRGPKFELVERAAGPLQRVKLDAVGPGAGSRRAPGTGAATPSLEEQVEATRRAAEDATRQARTAAERGSPPSRLSVVRPVLVPPPAASQPAPGRGATRGGKAAPPDTAR